MGWLGKIVGGTIGFAMGGPLGAVAGAIFGHAYDKGAEFEYQEHLVGRPQLSEDEEAQLIFFVAAFSMLAKLVQADGEITRRELDTIEKIMSRDLKLGAQSRNVAVKIFNRALYTPQTFQDYANQFRPNSPVRRFWNLTTTLVDSGVHARSALQSIDLRRDALERRRKSMLLSAGRIFRFSTSRYDTIKSRHIKATDRYYSILGCSRSDANEQIKSSYRKLVREFHPDAIAAKGLPEEFTSFAQAKFREIQEAYEGIKEERGIK